MIVNNIRLRKFFAKAQQATQVVELTLTYARKVNSFGDFNYLNTLPPFQVRSRSVSGPFQNGGRSKGKWDLHRLWYGLTWEEDMRHFLGRAKK